MTTPVTPTREVYDDVIEDTPYNFNVPVSSELEVLVEFQDVDGNDITDSIDYTLETGKSVGSILFDINTVSINWVGLGDLPLENKLIIKRRTSELQQTLFEFRSDLSVETAQEVDRLTRFQQDTNTHLDDIKDDIEEVKNNINPSIATDSIEDGSVTSEKIADNSINNDKLTINSVQSSNILDSAVTTSKLRAGSVTTSKIADEAITEAKLSSSSVTTSKIADEAITEAKLADDAVTSDKLSQDVLDRFDQNIPLKFSASVISSSRVRIEASKIVLNDESIRALGTGETIINFDGLEIDVITGDTYNLSGSKVGTNIFNFPVPSENQYRTYLVQANFGAISAEGRTPLVIDIIGGQESPTLGNQEFPKLGLNRELAIGYFTVQESGGSIAPISNSNLISLDNLAGEAFSNIHRVKFPSHKFNVGQSFIPVYWNSIEWVAASAEKVNSLATHLIIDVLSSTEFTIALSGRIFYPEHGFDKGVYYFTSDDAGDLTIIEPDAFSNPMLQGEDEDHFNLLGWRANEKSIAPNIAGFDRKIITELEPSTPLIINSSLSDIYSVSVYDDSRCKSTHTDIQIRVDDTKPKEVVLFSPTRYFNLRVDITGVV